MEIKIKERKINLFYRQILSLIFILVFPYCCAIAGDIFPESDALEGDAIELETITITETGESSDLKNRSNSITIITREQIENAAATTVDELLRTAAGIEVWKPQGIFGNASKVRMRGFAASRSTVFLKDGMPVDNISCGEILHNEIPLETVERVEVVRGAAGSVSGKSGMAGTINIVTRKASDRPTAKASVSYGSHNSVVAELGVGTRITDRFNVQAGYTHFDSDGYFAWNEEWIQDRVLAMDQNLLSWNNPDQGWSVKDNYLSALEKQTRMTDTFNAGLNGVLGEKLKFNFTYSWFKNENDIGYDFGYINQTRNRFNLNFDRKGTWDLAGNLFMLDQEVQFSQPVLPSPDMDAEQGENTWKVQGNKSDIPLKDYGGMLSVSKKIGKYNKIKLATDHRLGDVGNRLYDGLTGQTISITMAKQYLWGVTLEDGFEKGRLNAQAGIRYRGVRTYDFFYEDRFSYVPYEVSSLTDEQVDPYVGANYDLTDTAVLRASVSKSSTFAPLSYLLGDYERPPGKMIIGNPNLETEWAINYEVGLEKQFSSKVITQISLYYNDIHDWMQEVSASDPAYSSISVRWENIERAVSKGLEFAVDFYPTDALYIFANYTLNYSEVVLFEDKHNNYDNKRLEGNQFPDQARHKASLGAEWADRKLGRFNATLRYSGKRYYDIENSIVLDAYITCDLKYVRDFGKRMTFSLEAKDLFDAAWQESVMHNTPGRTIFAKLTLRL